MSYILDALRRAEYQRRQRQPQTIHSDPSALEMENLRASKKPWLLLIALLLLGNLLVLGLWRFWADGVLTFQREGPSGARPQLIAPSAETPPVPRAAAPQTIPQATPQAASPPAEEEEEDLPPMLRELSPVIKRDLLPLGIQRHIYAAGNPRVSSHIVLNGELLHEGERGSNGVEVVRIGTHEILLRYRKTEFRMKPQPER